MTLASIECDDLLTLQDFTGGFIADLVFSNEVPHRNYISTREYEIPGLQIVDSLEDLLFSKSPEEFTNYSLFLWAQELEVLTRKVTTSLLKFYNLISLHRKAKSAIYIVTENIEEIEPRIRHHFDTRIIVKNTTTKDIHYQLVSIRTGHRYCSRLSKELIPHRGKLWDAWLQLQ